MEKHEIEFSKQMQIYQDEPETSEQKLICSRCVYNMLLSQEIKDSQPNGLVLNIKKNPKPVQKYFDCINSIERLSKPLMSLMQ